MDSKPTAMQQRREAIVTRHMEVENPGDIEATIATFKRPRYEMNGVPHDGAAAVRDLLHGLMQAIPDLRASLIEGLITGTHDGEWQGIPATCRRIEFPVVAIFEFEQDRLVCEKVFLRQRDHTCSDRRVARRGLGQRPTGAAGGRRTARPDATATAAT